MRRNASRLIQSWGTPFSKGTWLLVGIIAFGACQVPSRSQVPDDDVLNRLDPSESVLAASDLVEGARAAASTASEFVVRTAVNSAVADLNHLTELVVAWVQAIRHPGAEMESRRQEVVTLLSAYASDSHYAQPAQAAYLEAAVALLARGEENSPTFDQIRPAYLAWVHAAQALAAAYERDPVATWVVAPIAR